jgi:hypothetical protein
MKAFVPLTAPVSALIFPIPNMLSNDTSRLTFNDTSHEYHTPISNRKQIPLYSASHSRVAPENVGLQKELKYNTFACHTCNEVRLCVLGIRKKEAGNTKR